MKSSNPQIPILKSPILQSSNSFDGSRCTVGGAAIGSAFECLRLRIDDDDLRDALAAAFAQRLTAALQLFHRVGREAELLVVDPIRQPLMVEARRIHRFLRIHPE